jgi:hypothetical protein
VSFFVDFSRTPVGKPPLDWHSSHNNAGASSVVVELKGLEGHWALVSGVTVTPTQIKGSLPRDFTLSYDLVAARDYTWGARGITLRLSKGVATSGKDSVFSVRLRPGFGDKDGRSKRSSKARFAGRRATSMGPSMRRSRASPTTSRTTASR